ncbi:universal stress protein [Algoriphagus formosus]|nr:universal stress protein [Algoriphagus aquimaris]
MKKILYSTDFSKNAGDAFPLALEIAKKHGAELHFLNVIDIPTAWDFPYTDDPLVMEEQALSSSEKGLEEFINTHYSNTGEDLRFFIHSFENTSVVGGILACIEKINPDLLVVGIKGSSKVRELLIGSTTKALLSESPVPVLAIPEESTVRDFNQVLYLSDIVEDDIPALNWLVKFVTPFDPEIEVTHVSTHFTKDGENMFHHKEELMEKVNYSHLKITSRLFDSINKGVFSLLSETKVDLLVMLEKEKKGFWGKLLHRDHVKQMEFRVSIPLLAIPQARFHSNS